MQRKADIARVNARYVGIVPLTGKGLIMLIDKMHTEAIRAANESMLPQTVYRIGNNWFHTEATWARAQLRDAKRNDVHMVATWLPVGFFN